MLCIGNDDAEILLGNSMFLSDRLSRALVRVYFGLALGIGISVIYIVFLVVLVPASSTPMGLIPIDAHPPTLGDK